MAKKSLQKNYELTAKFEARKVFIKALGLVSITGYPLYKLIYLTLSISLYLLTTTGHVIQIIFSHTRRWGLIINELFKRAYGITESNSQVIGSILGKTIQKVSNKLTNFIYVKYDNLKKLNNIFPGLKSGVFSPRKIFYLPQFIPEMNFRVFLRSSNKTTRKYFIKNTKHIKKFRPRKKISTIYPIAAFVIVLFSTAFYYGYHLLKDLPSIENLKDRKVAMSTKIYDRNGILLYNIYKDQNRTVIPIDKIPLRVQLATLAAEDAEFYFHPGISIKGILRAFIKNATEEDLAGGSTITQQLVKNALLTPEKTFTRKLREIILAIQVETKYEKEDILEMYLNEVSYGGTAYGIQEASRAYFDKDVEYLTLSEAAFLAGLTKSPTRFSPYGDNLDLAYSRQKDVLHLMRINGYISEDQENVARAQNLKFSQKRTEIKAPHFVMYTRQILEEELGADTVSQGGLKVTTTLDYQLQRIAEEVVQEEVESLAKLNVTNASVVVLDPKTGEILAMVGSKDYFDEIIKGNVNIATSLQPPGSSIKVVNYAYALSHGMTASTIISDSPVTYDISGQKPYIPKNYDGKFRGDITLRSALAESRNIPAVRVLASYGVNKMIEMGRSMGITTWEESNRFGLSLTLGGGEIKLIDLASVYATIANYGEKPLISPVINIVDADGKSVYVNQCVNTNSKPDSPYTPQYINLNENCEKIQVLDPRVSFILTDILKDNNARTPAFGQNSQLVIANHPEVAVKTGTSNDLRDNLTIGYNQDYVVAVWVGNNDNSPMSRVASGVTGASPIFNKIMSTILKDKESVAWSVPDGVIKTATCSLSHDSSCGECGKANEWYLVENKPTFSCGGEYVEKINKEKKDKIVLENRNLYPN